MYDDDEDDIPKKVEVKEKTPPPPVDHSKTQMKFLQAQMMQRKNAKQTPSSVKRPITRAAPPPVMDLSNRNRQNAGTLLASNETGSFASGNMKISTINKPVANPGTLSFLPTSATDESFMLFGECLIKKEYRATAPNDYEKLARARNERKLREKTAKKVAKRLAKEHEEEEEKRSKGAAIAPPPMFDSSPERPPPVSAKEDKSPSDMPPPSFLPVFGKATSRGLGIAASIMAKYGHKEGQGLGKQEQGISKALKVERSGKGLGGVIVGENKEVPPPPSITFATNTTEAMKNSSKVLLLTNMIGLDELKGDYGNISEFEEEIKEEMSKCGQVSSIVAKERNAEIEAEMVRVFVEFTNIAQAIKGFVVMNGRFFGGRSVIARFYDPDEYKNGNFDL